MKHGALSLILVLSCALGLSCRGPKSLQVLPRGALVTNVPIYDLGNAVICGHNHSSDTPYDDGIRGRMSPAPSPPNDPRYCIDNETGVGDQPGVWSTETVTPGGNAIAFGTPDILSNQPGKDSYAGPWDCFGTSQSEFRRFVGAPRNPASITNWNGVLYLDNNNVRGDQSCAVAPRDVTGEGFLYVDGDLHLNSSFHYRGFIYVEGDFDCNGDAWVLGSVVVKGKTSIRSNGRLTLLYSSDAITQALTRYGGRVARL